MVSVGLKALQVQQETLVYLMTRSVEETMVHKVLVAQDCIAINMTPHTLKAGVTTGLDLNPDSTRFVWRYKH